MHSNGIEGHGNYPTGTVTLVFTDIVGSSSHWEHYRRAFQPVIERHNVLARSLLEQHAGVEVRHNGDGFFLSFARASDAVHFAINFQKAISREQWQIVEPNDAVASAIDFDVRVGIHSGEAATLHHPSGALDYYSSAVNRAARIGAIGHGGQIVVSDSTRALAAPEMPPDILFLDLGIHQLPGVGPEHLWQVNHPELKAYFPPFKSTGRHNESLPRQLTPLVGRDAELEALRSLLQRPEVRLVTLTGPGGTGKSRLSIEAARRLEGDYEDGVHFVALGSIADAALVAPAIAQSLAVHQSAESSLEALQRFLRERHLLLILDNFEQVAAAADAVVALLLTCPALKIMVSSRMPLHVVGEHEFPVSTLALPRRKPPPTLQSLSQFASIELFLQRALAVSPQFQITNQNAAAVAELCHQLDGLPLAIELAASRIKLMSPEEMLQRLVLGQSGGRLTLLTGASPDRPKRQQTLRNTIDWSYSLLDDDEKELFARLAVFAVGFTLEAAEAVASEPLTPGQAPLDVMNLTSSLLDKSLLRRAHTCSATQAEGAGETRFQILEVVRDYALERLQENNNAIVLRKRHCQYYCELVQAATREVDSTRHAACTAGLLAEIDNVRWALEWAFNEDGESEQCELGLRLTKDLVPYLEISSFAPEIRLWLERALARSTDAAPDLRGDLLYGATRLAILQGDIVQARSLLLESLPLYELTGNAFGRGRALRLLGHVHMAQQHLPEAEECLNEAQAILTRENDTVELAAVFSSLSALATHKGNFDKAEELMERCLQLQKSSGKSRLVARTLVMMSGIALNQRDWERARRLGYESLNLLLEIGDIPGYAIALIMIGQTAMCQGDIDEASNKLELALPLLRELRLQSRLAYTLSDLGRIARYHRAYQKAGELFAEGLEICRLLQLKGAEAASLTEMARLERNRQNSAEAISLFMQSLDLWREFNDSTGMAHCFTGLAGIAGEQGRYIEAAHLMAVGEKLREEIGLPLWLLDKAEYEADLNSIKNNTDDDTFHQAWNHGAALEADSALTIVDYLFDKAPGAPARRGGAEQRREVTP